MYSDGTHFVVNGMTIPGKMILINNIVKLNSKIFINRFGSTTIGVICCCCCNQHSTFKRFIAPKKIILLPFISLIKLLEFR